MRWNWFRWRCGRDWLRWRGYIASVQFIARPDLAAEGYLIPVGLGIDVRMHPFRVSVRCDADEIATKLAAHPLTPQRSCLKHNRLEN